MVLVVMEVESSKPSKLKYQLLIKTTDGPASVKTTSMAIIWRLLSIPHLTLS